MFRWFLAKGKISSGFCISHGGGQRKVQQLPARTALRFVSAFLFIYPATFVCFWGLTSMKQLFI